MITEPDHVEAAIRSRVAERLGGKILDSYWLCDVKEATAETISNCNAHLLEQGRPVENKFREVHGKACMLSDLLRKDYEFLWRSSKFSILETISNQFKFYEMEKPDPNACIIQIEGYDTPIFAIVFNSPMVSLINSFFSKVYILTHDMVTAGCVPMYDSVMESNVYTDKELLLGLFNDIEELFVNGETHVPIYPAHVASPFDYCERVEGARRFIVGHEVAHAFFNTSRSVFEIDISKMKQLDSDIRDSWEREFWCDIFSINALMSVYGDDAISGPPLFELENALVGVLTYFTLTEIIECALHLNDDLTHKTHPPAYLRREMLRKEIKRHPIYSKNSSIPLVLNTNWKRLHSFREFAGGALGPPHFFGQWNRSEFHMQLSSFGKQAYKELFEATVSERNYYNWDMEKILANQKTF